MFGTFDFCSTLKSAAIAVWLLVQGIKQTHRRGLPKLTMGSHMRNQSFLFPPSLRLTAEKRSQEGVSV